MRKGHRVAISGRVVRTGEVLQVSRGLVHVFGGARRAVVRFIIHE